MSAPNFESRKTLERADAAVRDVADDGDAQTFQVAGAVEDGAGVEECLGGVLVSAVAGVDDGGWQVARQEMGRPGGGVAHDDGVGPHGREGVEGVHERLALGDARPRCGDGDGVRAEAFGGNLEAGARARGCLEEEVDDHLSAQRVEFFESLTLDGLKVFGARQNSFDLGAMQLLDPEQSGRHDVDYAAPRVGSFHEQHFFHAVDFVELYFDDFEVAGLHIAAHEFRFDGQFAMAAVDQDKELDARRAAVVEEGIERGADGAAGIEDVIHEDDVFTLDAEGYVGGAHDGLDVDGG